MEHTLKYNRITTSLKHGLKSCRLKFLLGASLFAVLPTTQAQSENEESVDNIQEVIEVKARRVGESIQDVPQTVRAVNSELMEKLNLLDFEDIEYVVPGLSLDSESNGFSTSASMRGVSYVAETSATPTIDFYFNDAPIESSTAFQSMFDIGQIEVLSGPQGTLRGRSAPSGAITVAARRPDLYGQEGYFNISASNLSSSNIQGAFNLPIIEDMLAVRFSGLYNQNDIDGVKSLYNDKEPKAETNAYRGSLLFTPMDNLEINLVYQNLKTDRRSFIQVFGDGADGANGPVITPEQRVGITDGARDVEQDNDLLVAQIDWTVMNHVVSYIGSHSKTDTSSLTPRDQAHWVPGAELYRSLDSVTEVNSHELRVSSANKVFDLFDYTVGVFYNKNEYSTILNDKASALSGTFGSPLEGIDLSSFNEDFIIPLYLTSDSSAKEFSIFANVTFDITDNTELALGLRQIQSEVVRDNQLDIGAAKIALPTLPEAFCGPAGGTWEGTYTGVCDLTIAASKLQDIVDERDDDNLIYNVSLSHRFNRDLMVYGTVGTSWRAGPTIVGLTTELDETLENFVFLDPEKSTSYEIGAKSSLWDNRARLNVALFRQDFEGFFYYGESSYYLIAGNGISEDNIGAFDFTSNADATVDGIDLDLDLSLTDDWNMKIGYSYSTSSIQDSEVPCNDSNFDGVADNGTPTAADFRTYGKYVALCKSDASVSLLPNWKLSLLSEYFFELRNDMEAYVRAVYLYTGENNNSSYTADAYGLLNLYTGIVGGEGLWEVGLYAKNVLNEEQALQGDTSAPVNSLSGMDTLLGSSGYYRVTQYTPRREVGISIRYSF